MSAPVFPATEWQWPPDVLAFAAKHKVQPYLDPLLEATQQIFPNSQKLQVYLEEDPEIRDDWHIIFDVQVSGLSVPQARVAQQEWNRALFRSCPAPLVCTFRLYLDLVP
jgi:hypothetical protein